MVFVSHDSKKGPLDEIATVPLAVRSPMINSSYFDNRVRCGRESSRKKGRPKSVGMITDLSKDGEM